METDWEVAGHSPRYEASNYRVHVAGTVPGSWVSRLGGLQIVEGEPGSSDQTLLMGAVRDQAELLGILNTLHALRLPLLLVEAVDSDMRPCRPDDAEKRT